MQGGLDCAKPGLMAIMGHRPVLRGLVRNAFDAILVRSPLQGAMERRASNRLRVLAYHGVDDPSQFERHMAYLGSRTRPVAMEGLLRHAEGAPLHPGAVLVTFDDGRRSVLEHALPALERRGIPAIVFVIAGHLSGGVPFWWDELEWLVSRGGRSSLDCGGAQALKARLKQLPDERRLEVLEELRSSVPERSPPVPQLTDEDLRRLVRGGVAVGNHTLTHPVLPRCSLQKAREEIIRAHERLTAALGTPPLAFAYPYGAVDERIVPLLQELGYKLVFAFDHRLNPRPLQPMHVSRLRVDSSTTLPRLKVTLSGLHPAIHAFRFRRTSPATQPSDP